MNLKSWLRLPEDKDINALKLILNSLQCFEDEMLFRGSDKDGFAIKTLHTARATAQLLRSSLEKRLLDELNAKELLKELLLIHQNPERGDAVWRLAVIEKCDSYLNN